MDTQTVQSVSEHPVAVQGMRIEVVGLNKWVSHKQNVLQNISLVIEPREFVVVVGQSGSGKSSLVDAISGYRPANSGQVYINGVDIYQNFDAVRNNIGYVPQRDIIHMELTPYEALDYAARLRLPENTTPEERHQRVMEALTELDLVPQKDTPTHMLSGGQQKRVSIGVELLTRPHLFFLDEPTSGLDPANEASLMQLMRKLADQGRTIVLITHATKNIALADKVVFLTRGGYLAYFGSPEQALAYFEPYRAEEHRKQSKLEFDELYGMLDDPSIGTPQQWGARYVSHSDFQKIILEPLQRSGHVPSTIQDVKIGKPAPDKVVKVARKGVSLWQQLKVLSSRNIKILRRDRASLTLMLIAPLIVASMDYSSAFVLGRNVFDYFDGDMYNAITSCFLSLMYGGLIGAFSMNREIVKEIDVYKRERLVGLNVFSYVTSKMWLAVLLALYQGLAFTFVHYTAYIMPGGFLELLLFYITISLACFAGMTVGLLASSMSKNPNATPLLVVMLIVPQLVLAGAMLPVPQWISMWSPTRWAYQTLIGISGAGSDVAADACWQLNPAERDALTLEDKEARNCICMGINAQKQEVCQFPGLGRYYHPAIDQPEPIEPEKPGDPPTEPAFPEFPAPPESTSSKVVREYFDALVKFNDEVESIRTQFTSDLKDYESALKAYERDLEEYLEAYGDWEAGRNTAVGKSEGEIDFFHKNYYWTYVDKDTPSAYWGKTFLGWGMMFLLSNVFIGIVMVLMRRKI